MREKRKSKKKRKHNKQKEYNKKEEKVQLRKFDDIQNIHINVFYFYILSLD